MEDRRRLLVLIAATTGAVLIPLNTSMLSVGLSPIVQAFGITNTAGTWLILLYLAMMTSMQPTAGKLGDRFGHRLIFMVGLALFAAASAGAALAPSFSLLILFRVLQGVGGAALAPNATALIRFTYPPDQQGYAMGLYVSAFSIGLTVGPVLAGVLVRLWGWQAIFWVNLPTVLVSAWIGLRVLPQSVRSPKVTFDWWGTGLFAVLVATGVLSANLWKEGRLPFSGWVVLPVLFLLGWMFVRVEERADDPLLRLSLFLLPGFGAANAAVFLLHTITYAILVAVPLYLQQGRGTAAITAGLVMAVYSVMQVVVAPFAGRLSDRFGRRPLVVVGGLLYIVGSLFLRALSSSESLLWVVGALTVTGIGTGLTSAPVQAASLAALPAGLVGVGSGVWYSSRYLGNICGALITGLLLPNDLTFGASSLYTVLAGIALLLALTARLLPTAERE